MLKNVTLLTGFLGSGKTTFLNAVLLARPKTRFAIIENEFGEEGIDSELIVHQEDNIVEMSNGCICCSLNDGLYDTLEMLYHRRDSFDELLIETTGIADPAGVAIPFLTSPAVMKTFPLRRVVCLVDAGLIEDQLRDTEEAIKQISFSDVILLNKIDTVTDAYADELVSTLRNINPLATILTGYKDEFPIAALFTIERDVEPLPPAQPRTDEFYAPPVHRHHHHHHVHSDIVSLSFRFTESFSMVELYHRLMTFLLFQSQGVYRIKGIVYEAGKNHRYIIQSVGQSLATTEGADWLPGDERISRFVIIGKLLQPQGFEKMLRQCFAKDPKWTTVGPSHLPTTPKLTQ